MTTTAPPTLATAGLRDDERAAVRGLWAKLSSDRLREHPDRAAWHRRLHELLLLAEGAAWRYSSPGVRVPIPSPKEPPVDPEFRPDEGVVYRAHPGAEPEQGVVVRDTERGVFVRYGLTATPKLTPRDRLERLT